MMYSPLPFKGEGLGVRAPLKPVEQKHSPHPPLRGTFSRKREKEKEQSAAPSPAPSGHLPPERGCSPASGRRKNTGRRTSGKIQSANPRNRSFTLVLLRVRASTCLTMTAQYSECVPSLDGSEPLTTTLYGGT